MHDPELIAALIQTAQRVDDYLSEPVHIAVHPKLGKVQRNTDNPAFVEMNAAAQANAIQHGWYVTADTLLAHGPPAFLTLDNIYVEKTAQGYTNPYGPTGLRGPGVLGAGRNAAHNPVPENRTVDIILQFIDPADGTLRLIGGVRKDTSQPCLIGGFEEGDAFTTAVREFVEEGISGSLEPIFRNEIGDGVDKGEAIYALIKKYDPGFLCDLSRYLTEKLHVAYRGPSRADPRNTDDRWMAGTVFTALIDRDELQALFKGRRYPYALKAGSDLAQLAYHRMDGDFITAAFGGNGVHALRVTAFNFATLPGLPEPLRQQGWRTVRDVNAWLEAQNATPCVPACAAAEKTKPCLYA